jgi:hypothetical protein
VKNLLIVLFSFIFILQLTANDKNPIKHSFVKENGKTITNYTLRYGNPLRISEPPGAIPGMTGFYDYVTNGNSIRACYVLGDTIIVSFVISDSLDPTGATSRHAIYNVSFNNGATWPPSHIKITTPPTRSSYPDINPFIGTFGRNVVFNGRQYVPLGRAGAAWIESFLGGGIISSYLVPGDGRDMFCYQISGNFIGCSYSTSLPAGDTLNYNTFDYINATYGSRLIIATPPGEIGANARQFIAAEGNDVTVMWWNNNEGVSNKMSYKQSTDGGSTFNTMASWLTQGDVFNGDSVTPWFGADIIYKPGTSDVYAAMNTLGFSGGLPNFGTRTGYKLLFWSPVINGGTPVVIADRTNYPVLMDTALFNQLVGLQVGATAVSHPSLAFSNDGTRLFCAFSGMQVDTLDGFNFNDIWSTYSDDGGATWSTPINLTNTTDVDEMYPSISKTGNTNTKYHLLYQATGGPGCQSFNDNAPTYRVWGIYQKINPETGNVINVKNISNEVPSEFSLKQNYPNPFNPTTSIRFEIAKNTNITLKVYDINGKEVAVLADNEFVIPGLKEVIFDGKNYASGIYFYTLITNDFKDTKKMVLLK